MTQGEIAYLVTGGGIVLFATVLCVYDFLARRQQRRKGHRGNAA